MKPSHSQQAAFDKEEARIRTKRVANEARALRFNDARNRTIGVDIAGLDQQVMEKRLLQQSENEEHRLQNIRAKEIDRILEQSVKEEKYLRHQTMQDMKRSWDDHKYEKNGRTEELDYRPEQFGASSMQVFAGEDSNMGERAMAKKDQMKKWTQENITEVALRKLKEKEEADSYAEMSSAIDEVRRQTEMEEKDLRRAMRMNIADYNRLAADDKARIRELLKEDARLNAQNTSLSLENHDEAATGVRRKDMFHGFTVEQIRRILQDNESIRQIKILKDESDQAEADEWAYSQVLQQKAMEAAHGEEDALRKQNLLDHQDDINRQRVEQRDAHDRWEIERRGAIAPEFFDKFGRSCR